MQTITHRQMRNDSASVLRQVQAGQSFAVTNNGAEIAWLSPPTPRGTLRVQRPATSRGGFTALLAAPAAGPSNAEILAELRGDRI